MELIVELIVGVSWPVAALVVAFMFRKEAVALLTRVTRLRYKELEADFGETLLELKAEAPPEFPSFARRTLPTGRLDRRMSELLELAEIAPRAAVLESWLEVEKAVRDLAMSAGLPESPRAHDQMRELVQKRVAPAAFLESIDELRRLRNTAAHSAEFEISAQVVQTYVDYAINLVGVLEAIKESRRGEPGAS